MREKISKIKSAEDESLRIIETARQEAASLIETAKQQSRKILETANEQAKKDASALIKSEVDSLEIEIKELMKQSIAEEEKIRNEVSQKIEQAEKHVIEKILERYSR